MNRREKLLCQRAIAALSLRNIFLKQASFTRPVPTPTDSAEIEILLATKRAVDYRRGEVKEDSAVTDLLQVQVDLGLRLLKKEENTPADKLPIYVEIEATFTIEYAMKKEVEEEAIKTFAAFNSVHSAWPFWRQHVYDLVSRGQLPRIDIPFFSGDPQPTRSEKAAKRKKKA